MGQEINLLRFYPTSKRPIEERANQVSETDKAKARKFDKEYFDGDRLTGYGGYKYNPKFWTDTVRYIVDYYKLTPDSKILDIGCAKGFMMHDLSLILPNAEIKGIDISSYAKENSIDSMSEHIIVGNANNLPYEDDYFDLVIAINTLHNLPLIDCKEAFREINRVSCKHAFVMNDAWIDDEGKSSMMKWNLTALTYMSVDDWLKIFDEVNYKGDYYWFFANK